MIPEKIQQLLKYYGSRLDAISNTSDILSFIEPILTNEDIYKLTQVHKNYYILNFKVILNQSGFNIKIDFINFIQLDPGITKNLVGKALGG